MAAFCHFWHMTPEQYWALPLVEHQAMCRYMNELFEGASDGT